MPSTRDKGTELLKQAYEHYRDQSDDTIALVLYALLLLRRHRRSPVLRSAAIRTIRLATHVECERLGLRLPCEVNGLGRWAQVELRKFIAAHRADARGVSWEASLPIAQEFTSAARALGLAHKNNTADDVRHLPRLRRELIDGDASDRALARHTLQAIGIGASRDV